MTTIATASVQRQCAHALMHILDMPGLADAVWYLHPDRLAAELVGQIAVQHPLGDAHAAVDAYILALGLSPMPDRSCGHGRQSFTEVLAQGEFMGVTVRVWAAADKGATS